MVKFVAKIPRLLLNQLRPREKKFSAASDFFLLNSKQYNIIISAEEIT